MSDPKHDVSVFNTFPSNDAHSFSAPVPISAPSVIAACTTNPRQLTALETNTSSSVQNSVAASSVKSLQSGELAPHIVDSVPKPQGLCGTAMCYVMNPRTGAMTLVRALLDSGANLTMLNREIAQQIGLAGARMEFRIDVAGGGRITRNEMEVTFQLVNRWKSTVTKPLIGVTTPTVGNPFSPVEFNPKRYSYLKDLPLADNFPCLNERPFHIIISEPYFTQMEHTQQVNPPTAELPMAKSTDLGWVLRGSTGVLRHVPIVSAYGVLASEHESFDIDTMYQSIGFDFSKFWSGENVGLSPHESMTSEHTALEIQAQEFQRQHSKYDADAKQWSVHLPWIDEDLEAHRLTDNMSRAVAMWHKVLRSVKPEHLPLVQEAYQDLLTNKFAEEVSPEEIFPSHPTYVMTSRPVFRLDKSTTKCRIVINASLPDQNDKNRTLNKLLMPGPNMLPQIMELVLKTMTKKYLVLIDVKKMFLSIKLSETSDKDMLRFVWAPPGSERPKLFRYRVLAFGVISSPFQAIWCLHETARMHMDKYPEAARIILEMTYMDDMDVIADSKEEAKRLTHDILKVLDLGGFYGHKISASDPEIVKDLDPGRLDQSRTVSVLGLKLDHDACEFMFDLEEKFDKFDANADRITRTDIVSLASQVFDTQGFVSPYIMQFKKILPMLWHNKTTWTENLKTRTVVNEQGKNVPDPVAAEAVERFCEWIKDIPRLKELRFPRYIEGQLECVAIFGDASKTGIGVVAYAVSKDSKGDRTARIIYSKSTLMPKNLREKAKLEDALTIARAELIAMLSCVNMSLYLQNALKPELTSDKIHIFTDSLLNLQRIQRGKGKCKPWEERRVCKILDNKEKSEISFCPGVMNPSDLPSRGCSMDELTERISFWKFGPEFLRKPKSEWPKQPALSEKKDESEQTSDVTDAQEELKLYYVQQTALKCEDSQFQAMAAQETDKPSVVTALLQRVSSLQKVRNILIRIKRWARKARGGNISSEPHSCDEIEQADLIIARSSQEKDLNKEIAALEDGKPLPKGSVLRNLPVTYDSANRVLRLRSRLHTSTTLPFDFANPIVIPKGVVAERMALEVHQRRFHCSQKATFNTLKEKYWICGGFQYVKDLVRKLCLTPRCRYIKFCSPKMSPLPDIRIDNPEPWRNTGVDYLGPIMCKYDCRDKALGHDSSGKCLHIKEHKVWLAVFTCMHTRAVNVQTVNSCTTEEFMNAFRKFMAQCSRPTVMYSDQAKTFKAADKQLRLILRDATDKIQSDMFNASCPIEWRFSTETAPWTNGCTERLVGIFKRQLMIVLQKHTLTLRNVDTIVQEITASVNDRPLGAMEENREELQITPNMLIKGRNSYPLQTKSTDQMSHIPALKMWLSRKKLMNQFWSKWQKDYLTTLSIDKKWSKDERTVIKPGDVVILKPETLEKGQWRLARVMDIHKNLDGVVTTASVKLPSGTVFTRTLRQIALLESACVELHKPDKVTEESIELSSPHGGDVRNEEGSDGSHHTGEPEPIEVTDDRPRPDPGPCPEMREQGSSCDYPSDGGAALPKLDSSTQGVKQKPTAQADAEKPRSKRVRRQAGYYKQLHDGSL